jgi:hypothetical protein
LPFAQTEDLSLSAVELQKGKLKPDILDIRFEKGKTLINNLLTLKKLQLFIFFSSQFNLRSVFSCCDFTKKQKTKKAFHRRGKEVCYVGRE